MYSESDIKDSYFYVNGGSKKGSRLNVEEKIKLGLIKAPTKVKPKVVSRKPKIPAAPK